MSIVSSNSQDIFAALREPDIKTTEYIISKLWPCQSQECCAESAVNAIACHWKNQLVFENAAAHIISSVDDLKAVAATINHNLALGKTELIQQVRSQLPNLKGNDPMVMNSIELVTRLFLMVNIQPTSSVDTQSLSTSVPWPDARSLADVLQSRFPHRPYPETSQPKKYVRILNVYNLEKIGGFSIQWTDNLAEHLMFEDNTIYLFYHVSLLYRMKESLNKDALPSSFFDETLDSLSLLIPRSNRYCARWFKEQQNKHFLDSALLNLKPVSRDISHYSFWRERLQILEEEFTESEPRTIAQWWFDKRKRVQWYTFWVAILVLSLTIFFGVAQTAVGIIQVWASIQSMKNTK